MNEYPLSPKSTIPELIEVLRHLREDALEAAKKPALSHAQYPSEERRAKAMFYIGHAELLGRLLWALDGTAVDEGSDVPMVYIN